MQILEYGNPQPTDTANQFKIELPLSPGHGVCDIYLFSSGLKLVIMQTVQKNPVQIQNNISDPVAGFGFCLAGEFKVVTLPSQPSFTIRSGETGFFSFSRDIEQTEHIETNHMLRLYLMLEGELLASFAQGDEDYFLPVFKSLDKKRFSRTVHHTTPLMRAILHQIFHCPYRGAARRFYLEGKAMELLSHKLEQLNPSNMHRDSKLKSADYERILHAAEILINNLEDPPNTRLLARSVGLSHSKLHRCFRLVYGVSPFEYLRDHRLQTAMLHLQGGKISVTEAALRVGYSNLSYFSKAFKATFGVAPGELLHDSSPALCQSSL